MYPYNYKIGQLIANDAGIEVDRAFIAHYHIAGANAITAAAATIMAAVTLGDAVTTTKTDVQLTAEPKCARVLTITGNAATATGNVVITGKDLSGAVITETIISTGAATVIGTKAFAYIDSIVFPARGAPGDTISVGQADKFGIPFKIPHNTVILLSNNGTPTTVASGNYSETVLSENHLDPTAALNGSDIDVYLLISSNP